MNWYAVVGGTLCGNRGAEAMVVTTIGKVRDRDPNARFLLMSYQPARDRELLSDPRIEVVSAAPRNTLIHFVVALVERSLRVLRVRLPDRMLPRSVRSLRRCRGLFDVSGISFHDGRLGVSAYNLMCLWPAALLGVPVVRLSQAMGPFRKLPNRVAARWALRRSLHSFLRGRMTAEYVADLCVASASWSVAADVAFSYESRFSLTTENEDRVKEVHATLDGVKSEGGKVVAVVPSSLVLKKSQATGVEYVGVLRRMVDSLTALGYHVLVMPNATTGGSDTLRNNDIVAIAALRAEMTPGSDAANEGVRFVDFDLNTASIRSLVELCELVVTSRFHAMVAALSLGVPTLVMGWSHKYEEVLELFGCAEYAVDFMEDESRLHDALSRALHELDSLRTAVREALPGVLESSSGQFEVVDRLSVS
jgi:colanic acid/amylovoran biosynthesis protein